MFGYPYKTAMVKTARYGRSIHQLLRPPEMISNSIRSPLAHQLISQLKISKVGHFILNNGLPSKYIPASFHLLSQMFGKNNALCFINHIFTLAKNVYAKHNSTNHPSQGTVKRDTFLEHFLGLYDINSLYTRITYTMFLPRIHPCIAKWPAVPGLKINNNFISNALARLFSIKNCYIHVKYSHELILGSFRTEKHLVHFPDHPTGTIRVCNFCLGTDSIYHIFVSCSLAQLLWLRYKLAVQEIIKLPFHVTKELIFLGKTKRIDKVNTATNKMIIALACATKYTIAHFYYARPESFSFEHATLKHMDNCKAVFTLYNKHNIQISMKCWNFLAGKNILCTNEIYSFLLKCRSALYQNNVDVDSSPRLCEIFTSMRNNKGYLCDNNLEYLRFCLKKYIYE